MFQKVRLTFESPSRASGGLLHRGEASAIHLQDAPGG